MSDLLKALYDEDWSFEMADNAEFASLSGFHDVARPEPLQDVSPAGYRRRAEHSAEMRRRVASILAEHGSTLSAQDKVRSGPRPQKETDFLVYRRCLLDSLMPSTLRSWTALKIAPRTCSPSTPWVPAGR